jgi:hypothetical protein
MTWGAAARMANTAKEKTMKNKNPYNFCTLDDSSDCASCDLMGKLSCKWDRNTLNGFILSKSTWLSYSSGKGGEFRQ